MFLVPDLAALARVERVGRHHHANAEGLLGWGRGCNGHCRASTLHNHQRRLKPGFYGRRAAKAVGAFPEGRIAIAAICHEVVDGDTIGAGRAQHCAGRIDDDISRAIPGQRDIADACVTALRTILPVDRLRWRHQADQGQDR